MMGQNRLRQIMGLTKEPPSQILVESVADKFVGLVAAMEHEYGHPIGGFARNEKTGQWNVIQPNGKFEPLVKLEQINNKKENPK